MSQEISYPDSAQLREYAEEPMPFHEFHATDLELLDNDRIRVGIGNTEYVYHPTHMLDEIEDSNGEREIYEYPDWAFPVQEAFDSMSNISIQEDYICGTVLTDSWYEVYWVLEDITISNPNLHN